MHLCWTIEERFLVQQNGTQEWQVFELQLRSFKWWECKFSSPDLQVLRVLTSQAWNARFPALCCLGQPNMQIPSNQLANFWKWMNPRGWYVTNKGSTVSRSMWVQLGCARCYTVIAKLTDKSMIIELLVRGEWANMMSWHSSKCHDANG
jgi:hypothetical protein